MSHITIRWDGNEGKVKINKAFYKLYDMARWDCLMDAIWELQKAYDKDRELFKGKEVFTMVKAKKKVAVKKKPVLVAKKKIAKKKK